MASEGLFKTMEGIMDKRGARVDADNQLYAEGKQSLPMNMMSGLANAAGVVGDTMGQGMSYINSLRPQRAQDRDKALMTQVANTDTMKSLGSTLTQFAKENPTSAKIAMNILDLSAVVGIPSALKNIFGKEFVSNFMRNMTNERKAFYSGNPAAMVTEAIGAFTGGATSQIRQGMSAQARANARELGVTRKTQIISQENLNAMSVVSAIKQRIVDADTNLKNTRSGTPERLEAEKVYQTAKDEMSKLKGTDSWKTYRKAGQLAQGQIGQDFLLARQTSQAMPLIGKLEGTTWISGGTLTKASFKNMLKDVDTINDVEADSLFRAIQQIHAPKGTVSKVVNKVLNPFGTQRFVEKPRRASDSSGDLAKDALRSENEVLRLGGKFRTRAAEVGNAFANNSIVGGGVQTAVKKANQGAKWVAGKFNKKFESDLNLPMNELRKKVKVYAGIKEVFQERPSTSTFETAGQFQYALKNGLTNKQKIGVDQNYDKIVGSLASRLKKAYAANPLLAEQDTIAGFMKQLEASKVKVPGLTAKRAGFAFQKKMTEPFANKIDMMEALESKGIPIYNKAKVLEDPTQPVLVLGHHKSTAYELGDVGIIHKLDLNGTVTNLVNDGNDLLSVPAPRGGEMYTFSTFKTNVAGKPNVSKKQKAKQNAQNKANQEESKRRGDQVASELGVDITDRPPNSMNPSEWAVLKAVAGAKAPIQLRDKIGAAASTARPVALPAYYSGMFNRED
jgi:hypothetical protein